MFLNVYNSAWHTVGHMNSNSLCWVSLAAVSLELPSSSRPALSPGGSRESCITGIPGSTVFWHLIWPKGGRGRRWWGGRRVRSVSKTLASGLRAECIPARKVTAPVTQSSPQLSFWAWVSKPTASPHSFQRVGRSNVPPYKRQADMLFLPIFVNTGCPHFLKVHFITTLSFQKIYIGTCFSLTKRNPEKISAFPKKRRKVKIEFGIFLRPEQREWRHQAPSLETTPNIPASVRPSSELCLWASVLCLHLFLCIC